MRLLTLLVVLVSVPGGQASTSSVVGSWTAQFKGTTFVRLDLDAANGAITGGISLGSFEVDDRGEVRRADAALPGLTPISDVTQRGSSVVFLLKEGDEPDRFEFHLIDGRRAELHLMLDEADRKELAASGTPTPRPILLTRQ